MFPVAWHPIYAHPVPEGHRFPMEKYELLPRQLLHEGTIREKDLFHPEPLPEKSVLRVHSKEYWEKLKRGDLDPKEERRTGFRYSHRLVERERRIMQGTVSASEAALDGGIGMNISGGTHHAFRERGEGFCLLNDLALSAVHCLEKKEVERVLIVDLDVHQGNGTARIFQEDERVFTFSMHGAGNFPMKKERSDLDLPLQDGTGDEAYLELLQEHLPPLLDHFSPDLVLYQSGVDVLANDELGRLNLSLQGCKERDGMVFKECAERGSPLAAVMGGGYSSRIAEIVEAHANSYRLALRYYR